MDIIVSDDYLGVYSEPFETVDHLLNWLNDCYGQGTFALIKGESYDFTCSAE